MSSDWTVGKVDEVEVSKDGVVRRCNIKYQNSNESFPRFTDRAARSLVKLMNIDDTCWRQDMDLVEKLIKELKDEEETHAMEKDENNAANFSGQRSRLFATSGPDLPTRNISVQFNADAQVARSKLRSRTSCKNCCCASHCELSFHVKKNEPVRWESSSRFENKFLLLDRSWDSFEDYENNLFDSIPIRCSRDPMMSHICAVNVNLADDFGL